MIKKEFNTFLTAVMFYTRIPCPSGIEYSADILNRATRYFPLIGWIVGGLVALVYWGSTYILPMSVSVILSMAAGIVVTGAFHEDGFADVCDGFGGGYTKEMRLSIMKDSRIGTYGTVGLIFIFLLKFYLLSELSVWNLSLILIVAHSFSRFVPVVVIRFGNYSRDDLTSKAKPIGKKIRWYGFVLALFFGLLPIILFENVFFLAIIVLPLASGLLLMRYFNKRIDGYTGDCLGTIQQIAEICVYISILILYKFL